MKLYEAISRLNKVNNAIWIDTDEIGRELELYNIPCVEQNRLEGFYLSSWLCTDSIVGQIVYFFDNEPVALSTQDGRKSDKYFDWFSLEKAKKVRDYLLSLSEDENGINVSIIDTMDYEIYDGYGIDFNGNLLDLKGRKAYYNNEEVTLIERIRDEKNDWGIDTKLKIKDNNEKLIIVDIRDLIFPFHIDNY